MRIVGNLRSFQGQRSLVAFRVLPVADMNEITFHNLQAIYVHLVNTKGVLVDFL